MAESAEKTAAQDFPAFTPMGVLAPAVGWLIPGAGHFLVKRWGRGLILMVTIITMFILGVLMDGKVYRANTGDILDMLGFVGDLGAGGLYFITRAMDWGQGAISFATAAYGTAYILVSGLLNIICAVDAHHIAIGKKK